MKIAIIFSFLFLSFGLFSQTYYVDGVAGNNANSGTSLGAAWKTIQKSMNSATPGSTVYIKGGTYIESLGLNVSGTAGNYITFRNYQNDIVIVDGNNLPVTLLYVANKSYFTIRGLIFQNTLGNGADGVIITGTSHHIIFRKNIIQNIRWTASASTIPTSSDNISPFLVYGNSSTSSINNLVIDSNEIRNNINGYSENLTLDGNVEIFSIANNSVHDNTNIGIDCAGNFGVCSNPLLDQARNGTISNNICYNNISNVATSAGIYLDGSKDIIVERNKTYGNGYGIEVGAEEDGTVSGIIVRDNLIYNNKKSGFIIGGYTTATTGQVINSSFTNNTLFANGKSMTGSFEMVMSKASNCVFQNNIIYSNNLKKLFYRVNILPQAGNTFSFNTWYTPNNNASSIVVDWGGSSITNFASFLTSSSDVSSNYTNPFFVDTLSSVLNFHLLPTSVCIDAGNPTFTVAAGEKDLDGNNRLLNLRVDKGAYEYSPVLTVPSNTINPIGLVCSPSSITFSSTSTNSPTVYSWTLSSTTSTVTSSSATPTFSINSASSYTISLISQNGIGSSALTSYTFSSLPSPTIIVSASSSSICAGSSATISATGATTYSWNTGATTSNIGVSPIATTVYTVTGTTSGCSNTKTISIAVVASPTVIVSASSSSICSGSSTTISATGATTYSWNTGATASSIGVSPIATTVYTVTGTTSGCSNTKTISIAVVASPTVIVSASSLSLCSGSSVTISATGATTYSWNTGATASSIGVSPIATTVYTVTGKTSGCSNTKTISITVTASPTVIVSASSPSLCSGSSVTISATGAATYSWNTGATASSIGVSPIATTVYTVVGKTSGCSNTKTINITVTASSTITTSSSNSLICIGQSVILSSIGAVTYTWTSIGTGSTITVSPTVTTTYTVIGVNSSGCQSSSTIIQTVSLCTNIENNENEFLLFYPNPSNGIVNFKMISNKEINVEVFDVLGNCVYKGKIENGQLNISYLNNGLYQLKANNIIRNIIIQK